MRLMMTCGASGGGNCLALYSGVKGSRCAEQKLWMVIVNGT